MMDYPKASNAVVFGGIISYSALIMLVIAFFSPYWVESYEETFSSFKNMGLWEYCFEKFRFPNYQFDKQFDGCHNIYSQEYYVMREWLLPGWLLFVEAFVSISLLLSYVAQGIVAMIVVRYPLKFVLANEWLLSSCVCVCNCITGVLLFLSLMVFWVSSSRRDWLMYPNFNHISWSYGFASVSCGVHFLGAYFLYYEAQDSYKRRKQSRNLVMLMQPNPQSHHTLQRTNYI